MKYAFLFFSLLLTVSCNSSHSLLEEMDRFSFCFFGGTLFSDPNQVTMKEIHLDNGGLMGREVIIEGDIMEVGKHDTYLVLDDKTARMLVVLTDMADSEPLYKEKNLNKVRVLGTLNTGKKGMPFVMARAITESAGSKL